MNTSSGQSTLQLILPLAIVLLFSILIASYLPTMSFKDVIVLGAGIILFMASFASTQIALYFLIFSMLLSPEFIIGQTGGPTLGRGITLRLDDFILAIIAAGWLARTAVYKELGLVLKTPLNTPIFFYIVASFLSTLLGIMMDRVRLSTGILFVLKYFQYMVIYFMVVNFLHEKKQVQYFVWALLSTCVVVSLLGIAQVPAGGRVSAPFEGEIGEPNTFGGYLLFMIAVSLGLFFTTPLKQKRLLYAGIAFVAFIPFLYTQSRSSYLALFPMLLGLFWLSEKRKLIIIWILFMLLFLPLASPKFVMERITYTFQQAPEPGQMQVGGIRLDTSTSARIKSWRSALKDTTRHPIFGFGVTGYQFVDAQYPRVFAESGLIGIMCFLWLMAMIMKYSYLSFRQARDPLFRGLSMGFIAGFIGLLVHAIGANTFIIVRIMEPFWFILGMVIMIPEFESRSTVEETS